MKEITNNEFEQEVLQQPTAVVKFWAPWCGPCKMVAPIVERVAESTSIPFVSVNIDEQPDLAQTAGVKSIPAILFYKEGRVVERIIGAQQEKFIREKLSRIEEKNEVKSQEVGSESNPADPS